MAVTFSTVRVIREKTSRLAKVSWEKQIKGSDVIDEFRWKLQKLARIWRFMHISLSVTRFYFFVDINHFSHERAISHNLAHFAVILLPFTSLHLLIFRTINFARAFLLIAKSFSVHERHIHQLYWFWMRSEMNNMASERIVRKSLAKFLFQLRMFGRCNSHFHLCKWNQQTTN